MRITSSQVQTVGLCVDLGALPQRVGRDNFYTELARLDPANARRWCSMERTQLRFKAAEPGYRNPDARTYSESCRETLHRLAIRLWRQGYGGRTYDALVRLHPSLFKENGACHLPVRDQLNILWHVQPDMVVGHGNPVRLAGGLFNDAPWVPMVHEAAEETRHRRGACGLPVTTTGYSEP